MYDFRNKKQNHALYEGDKYSNKSRSCAILTIVCTDFYIVDGTVCFLLFYSDLIFSYMNYAINPLGTFPEFLKSSICCHHFVSLYKVSSTSPVFSKKCFFKLVLTLLGSSCAEGYNLAIFRN